VFLEEKDLEWALPLVVGALDETLEEARGRRWLGNRLLLPAKREELRRILERFLVAEVDDHTKMTTSTRGDAPNRIRTGADCHELAFTDLVLERGGVRFRFRGFIDRVGRGVDDRFDSSSYLTAIDYKTSRYAAPGGGGNKTQPWEDGVVLQVPLYAWALLQLQPEAKIARVEYWALKKPERVHSLELHRYDRKSGEVVLNEEDQSRMEAALDRVAHHVRRVRQGEFPASPAQSCGCPDFCHAIEICRVAGGPKTKDRR